MNNIGTRQIESERLILRKFTLNDDEAVFNNWASDKAVTKFLTWPAHRNIEVTRKILKEWTSNYKNKDFYQWAIVVKKLGNQPIGSISAVSKNEAIDMVHIGYCIGSKYWHQGITSEALSMIIDFFFNEVNVKRIESRHDPRNINSGAVMKKCGMEYEGTLRQADWNNQGICDAAYYAILKNNKK